jgi:hypothetical protein
MRLQQDVAEVLDKWLGDVNSKELFESTIAVLLKVFTRIENMTGTLSAEWLMDSISYNEARELLRAVLTNNHLDHYEKKD